MSKNKLNTPNYNLRKAAGLAGLTAVAATAGLGFNALKNVHDQDALDGNLTAPAAQVAHKLQSGVIDKSKVVVVRSDEQALPYNVAAELAKDETDTPALAETIAAQEKGNTVGEQDTLILDKSQVNQQAVQEMNQTAELHRVLPDDPNIHVG